MMMTGAKAFVDTNILLRAISPRLSLHQTCETLIYKMWADDVELWISRQVIREYLVQVTHSRTFETPLTSEAVLEQVQTIRTLFSVANETALVTTQLLDLIATYPVQGKQIHDGNIVATMLAYGIDTLLTLNASDFRRFEDRITLIIPEEAE